MLLSYLRTICLYLVLILVVRLMGKRQIGEMEPAEFVVTMLIANLAAIPMQDSGIPLLSGLVPILTVLGVQLILAVASMRFISFRRLLCGKPVILIREGTIDQTNLRRARITLDELTEHLRERRSWIWGRYSTPFWKPTVRFPSFPTPQYKPASAKDAGLRVPEQSMPVTIVSDGKLLESNLAVSGRDRAWLGHQLRSRGCPLRDTYLLTVDGKGNVYFIKKEAEN